MPTIPLTNGGEATVDAADYPAITTRRWHRNKDGYAQHSATIGGRWVKLLMHRVLLGVGAGEIVDHIDGNPLNNTRANLRRCTTSENAMNRRTRSSGHSSRFKGVTWNRRAKKWQAAIKMDGVSRYLGMFATEEEAARAYDAAAVRLFGEYAAPNFAQSAA